MTYKNFEDLPAWQAAADLYDQVDDFLDAAPPRLRPSFRDQLERAALSVSNNIAEGFERGTTNELLAFLYIARGSAGEVRSMLRLAVRRHYLANHRAEILRLIGKAEMCSRQLRGWAASLQDSDIQGQRHLNRRTRAAYEDGKRHDAFLKKLRNMLPPDHPARKAAEEKEREQLARESRESRP